MTAPGSKVPAEFQREAGRIASRLIRKLRLNRSQSAAVTQEFSTLIRRCTASTMKMVEEEFILIPRDHHSVERERDVAVDRDQA